MKIYVTRHGQVAQNGAYYNGDAEINLTELGRQQATLLGKRMRESGFQGKIYSSPLLRTMETAELIAEETGSVIVPVPWLHEIFSDQSRIDAYQGYSLEELRKCCSHIADDVVLEYPWWTKHAETSAMVLNRVSKGLEEYLREGKEDVILVGHGASGGAVHDYLHLREGGLIWNCCLGLYDTEHPENNFGNDVSHLPKHMISSNKIMGMDIDFDIYLKKTYQISLPEKLREEKGVKLLHIGDTHSITYPYYTQIIKMVRPDIIVHTGDSADEVKVGRIPGTEAEYLEKVQVLLDILKDAKCKVYWVPGNNDLPKEIAKRAPFIEVVQPDTVLQIEGVDFCLTHSKEQITKKADIYLYGHGRRAENGELEKRVPGSDALYLNVMWNTYVCVLPQKDIYEFTRPEYKDKIWK